MSPWQNACWVVDVPQSERESLFDGLKHIAGEYRQDSIAVMVGKTEFIRTGKSNGKDEKQN